MGSSEEERHSKQLVTRVTIYLKDKDDAMEDCNVERFYVIKKELPSRCDFVIYVKETTFNTNTCKLYLFCLGGDIYDIFSWPVGTLAHFSVGISKCRRDGLNQGPGDFQRNTLIRVPLTPTKPTPRDGHVREQE